MLQVSGIFAANTYKGDAEKIYFIPDPFMSSFHDLCELKQGKFLRWVITDKIATVLTGLKWSINCYEKSINGAIPISTT